MKAVKWLDERFEETLLAILLVLISCVEFIQVVIRNVPWIPALTWAEEFCRFCWIWSVFLSLPYTVRKASMLQDGTERRYSTGIVSPNSSSLPVRLSVCSCSVPFWSS